jgi:DNA-binding NarL/FixJ family response regulator
VSDRPAVRVLVVDDASALRLVVRTALERDGAFTVVGEAADGAEAIRVAADLQPEIVLLDLDMPGVGGIEALPDLRRVAPNAQIVILSGLPRARMEATARGAGAVGYIEKGVPSRRLVDELIALAGLLETVDGVLAEAHATFPEDRTAPGAARRLVDDTLRRWDCADALGTVSLLVSELVTNAVVHAHAVPEVAVLLCADRIRVEVADDSPELPTPRRAGIHDTSGRGLAMVEDMSAAWGADPDGNGGKVVWFEVPRLDDLERGSVIR